MPNTKNFHMQNTMAINNKKIQPYKYIFSDKTYILPKHTEEHIAKKHQSRDEFRDFKFQYKVCHRV